MIQFQIQNGGTCHYFPNIRQIIFHQILKVSRSINSLPQPILKKKYKRISHFQRNYNTQIQTYYWIKQPNYLSIQNHSLQVNWYKIEKSCFAFIFNQKERKKRLRKIRMDIQKEKQDKIRLGLQKPSPPRITLQNMMAILGAEAQIDPSKAEQEVRRQIQARLDKHIKQNEERKLTKEQRGDKLKQKWQKDAAQEIRVAVFRIDEDLSSTDLETKKLKFKVDMNAQQVSLQGVCLIANQNGQQIVPSILVAEGGPKGIKFYKKLLLNRIKWRCDDSKLGCTLVWEGVAKQHAFNKWRTIEIKSEAEGKRILAEKGVEQFWDLAMNNHQN